ncbi:MAG TPA: FkbM family methyltransferase [Puia sp.]|nr:FkbM family methyltransferase [Puia sp.]
MIKKFLAKNFPVLRKSKRLFDAVYNSARPAKKTYSSHGEDLAIQEILQSYDLKGSIYVDVGANHPAVLSNSYLLYRKGYHGIAVEPNQELARLLKRFRPKDIVLAIGCGKENSILPFHISKEHVLSTFSETRQQDVSQTLYLPIMRLDDAIKHMEFNFISLLSIDVEGLNFEVLEGARDTLEKSLLLCVEIDRPGDHVRFSKLLGTRFEFVREIGYNVMFVNNDLKNQLQKNKLPNNNYSNA